MKSLIVTALALFAFTGSALAQITTGDLQYWRGRDKDAVNVFEPTKDDSIPFTGVQVRVGGAFALQYQALEHESTALPNLSNEGVDLNELYDLAPGFNLATANLNLDVQLADGIRMELVTFLSSRHHPEAYVKGGYLQIDKLPFLESGVVDKVMDYVTVRVGHMEINYGDAHFRRTDNGSALMNPFVGNYIMDAYATEIGGEVYFQNKMGMLAMLGASNGLIKGDIQANDGLRNPSIYGKLGFDNELTDDLRVRLTGSMYHNPNIVRNTLYAGDRAGSRYYLVMENTLASTSGNFTSGRFNPDFSRSVTAVMVNPFVKFHGLEVFGLLEVANGHSASPADQEDRTWNQYAVDVLYRIGAKENFYVGGRYNMLTGEHKSYGTDVAINRMVGTLGWFISPNILAKVEYVNQEYLDFPSEDILNGGRFHGVVLEGAISF